MPAPTTIDQFMTPEPCGVHESLTIADATDRMQANNIRHLVVISEGEDRLAGVVSLADLRLAASVSHAGADKTPVRDAARPALVCTPKTPLIAVALQMEAAHLDCAVVVGDDDYVSGIFTVTDALRAVRSLDAGQPVAPAVTPTHQPTPEPNRKQVLPGTRVKRMLRSHHAAPNPNQGTAFGKVFP